MNRTSHKCACCKKSISGARINRKYCSNACRQKAYEKRKKAAVKRTNQRQEPTLSPAVCVHCGGGFWARTRRAAFCSTSCRTLHHRAMKAAMPNALGAAYGLPIEAAQDVVDTQPIAKLRGLLVSKGYRYQHDQRQWAIQGAGD